MCYFTCVVYGGFVSVVSMVISRDSLYIYIYVKLGEVGLGKLG